MHMRETEQTAKTVEEAIEQGLHLLGAKRDEVEVEILEEPGGGVFGLGAKQARVRVMVPEIDTSKAQEFLERILQTFGLSGMVEASQGGGVVRFEILGDDLGLLIGHRGQTLNAIQFLLGTIISRSAGNRKLKCVLDVEGYRVRREKSLQVLAENMAKKASRERRSVALEPMLPHERRIIHLALQGNPYVTTSSQGDEPLRKVVITPKEGAPRASAGRNPNRTRTGAGGYGYGNRSDSRAGGYRSGNRSSSRTSGSRWAPR